MSFSARDLPEPSAPDPALEEQVRRIASAFAYPPVPDLARREGQRVREQRRAPVRTMPRFALALLLVVILAAALLLASPARARVLEWLRVGAVRIFLVEPTATATAAPTPLPTGTPQPTSAPTFTPLPPESLLNLSGPVSLEEADAQAPFTLRLPAYPADLGAPQRVYYQEMDRIPVVIMVWTEPDNSEKVRLALYQIGEGSVFEKHLLRNIVETKVNGSWALWTEGPYVLVNTAGEVEERRLVTGRTLLWFSGDVTYRLETALPLTEARQIAESLEPIQ